MKKKYDRHWAIRVGNPGEHILYFSSTIFWKRKDALEEIKKYKNLAKTNHWKVVEIVEKRHGKTT